MQLECLSLFALLAFVPPSPPVDAARPACCPIDAPAAKTPTLDSIKDLAGTWYAVENGKLTERIVSEYRVTAGGSVVIETVFPKSEMEMISMYFTEGDALWLAHYCMFGNHPRLKAEVDGSSGDVVWRCQGGENFTNCATTDHMHEGRVVRIDADRIVSTWTAMRKGKAVAPERFEIARKR
jgi:hypothetical protein